MKNAASVHNLGMSTFVGSGRRYFMFVLVVICRSTKAGDAGGTIYCLGGSDALGLECGRHFVVGARHAVNVSSVGSMNRRSCTLAPGGG